MTSLSNDSRKKPRGEAPCPICRTGAVATYRPFCSKRCADIDLHRWLSGGYAIPAVEEDSDEAPSNGDEPSFGRLDMKSPL
ncbi:MAG: DNA gyrase inhibitor YacG [Hyphococcus sp.]